MTPEQLPLPAHDAQPAPTMELLEGDATQAPAAGSSRLIKIARGAMYGMLLLAATALLAVSAVPELARYASFVPEQDGGACHAATAGGIHCTTLDQVSVDSPCCVSKLMASFNCDAIANGDGSSGAAAKEESLVAAAEASGCSASGGCPFSDAVAEDDQPIDAGALLAAADEPVTEQPAEDAAELKTEDAAVEE